MNRGINTKLSQAQASGTNSKSIQMSRQQQERKHIGRIHRRPIKDKLEGGTPRQDRNNMTHEDQPYKIKQETVKQDPNIMTVSSEDMCCCFFKTLN